MKLNYFAKYGWGVLAFTILVILWGAFVRATGSGAGCGRHWPSCNGEVIPWTPQIETAIEFTHRLTSGLAFLLVVGLLVWAFRAYPKGHTVRMGATISGVAMVLETLVGAALVLFQLVAYDTSTARAVVAAIHLVNTFILLAALTLTAWWASGGAPIRWRRDDRWGWVLGIGFVGMLVLAASGGVTALGDTLFPATSLAEGLQQKFSPTAHFLVRLRLYHPIIAVAAGAYIIVATAIFNARHATVTTQRFGKLLTGVYLGQLVIGAFNVVLLAPVWMQIVHLFISDVLLILLVLFIAAALGQPAFSQTTAAQSLVADRKKVLSRSH